MLNVEQLTLHVREIAVSAGQFLREERKAFRRERVEEKNAHDYVSYVDKASERRLVEALSALLPQAGFIAEEGTASRITGEYCWVVDPLDGTTNFIHDTAPYCVSIALRRGKQTLLGVVYEVCRDECFWAYAAGGAYLNGQRIHTSSVADPDRAFVAIGFPYDFTRFKPFAEQIVHRLYGSVGGIRLQGAAAAELCYVAAGRFEARIEPNLGAWDVAAGELIVREAGGRVTDFAGGDSYHSGHQVIASNGLMHDWLLKTVGE